MKKTLSMILAVVMIVGSVALLASCAKDGDPATTTDGDKATTTVATTVVTTKDSGISTETTPVSTGGDDEAEDMDLIGTSVDTQWHYKVFSCPYNSGGAGGEFPAETDEFAAFQEGHGWDKTGEIPADVLTEMAGWETSGGPFGDRQEGLDVDIGWTGDNHGLMIYTTFEVENLEQLKKNYNALEIWCFYDNTCYIYINGKPYFINDANCQSGDWLDSSTILDPESASMADYFVGDETDLLNLLVEGTNSVVITLKDCWGGRECDFTFTLTNY